MTNIRPTNIITPEMDSLAPPKLYRSWTIEMTCKHCGGMFQCHHSYHSLKNIQNETIKENLRFAITNYCVDCGDNIIKHAERMDESLKKINGKCRL